MPESDETHKRSCSLEHACGREVACAGPLCAFWETESSAPGGHCAFDSLDISARPELASWLLEIRHALESATSATEAAEARRAFFHRLNAGRAD